MTEEEKRALLDGVRGEVFERALSEAQHDREAAMLRRERDEARVQLAAVREAVREVVREVVAANDRPPRRAARCCAGHERYAAVHEGGGCGDDEEGRMSRDEIEALVARAMATRCHGTCDDTEHRMLDALCAEVELLRMERDALLSAAREGNAIALRAIAERDEAREAFQRIHSMVGLCDEAANDLLREERDEARLALAKVERERDEPIARAERAEAQLAALRAAAGPHAASEYASDAETRALRIVLADAEDAAEAYRASVVEEATAPLRAELERLTRERDEYARLDCSVQHDADRAALGVASLRAETAEAERDTLAAALAEVRDATQAAMRCTCALPADECAAMRRLRPALATLPADLAAGAFRRVRAEALREAADRLSAQPVTAGLLREWADEIERGER